MVVDVLDEDRIDQVLHALADTTRRDILRRSMGGGHSVSELARRYPMSFAAVQKHVAVLERAGLVSKDRRGREQLVRSNIETIRAASRVLDQLEELWRVRLHRFGEVLAELGPDGAGPPDADRPAPPAPHTPPDHLDEGDHP